MHSIIITSKLSSGPHVHVPEMYVLLNVLPGKAALENAFKLFAHTLCVCVWPRTKTRIIDAKSVRTLPHAAARIEITHTRRVESAVRVGSSAVKSLAKFFIAHTLTHRSATTENVPDGRRHRHRRRHTKRCALGRVSDRRRRRWHCSTSSTSFVPTLCAALHAKHRST